MKNDAATFLRSVLFLMGAFVCAFLFGEMVHDSGHYFTHKAYGNTSVQVHFDPFGGTHISGAGGLSEEVLGVTSLAGPLSNLLLGLVTFAFLWQKQRPFLMPLVLWGPVAMIQEGVTFSLGQLTPGGDAQWIAALGIPLSFLLIIGILLLILGLGLIAYLLPSFGIQPEDTFGKTFLTVLLGMVSLMLIRAIHASLLAPTYFIENLIPLIFSLVLALLVSLLRRPVRSILKAAEPQDFEITWPPVISALSLGAGIFILQLILK